jgi:hypothetical protein
MPFSCFNYKKAFCGGSHLTVTLQIMSNSRRSASVIIAHIPIYIKHLGGTVTIAELDPASNITLEFFI